MKRRHVFASAYDRGAPEVPDALVALIDALRDYLEAEQEIREELSLQGSLTAADCERHNAALQPFRLILADLEQWQLDPTLKGLLPGKRP